MAPNFSLSPVILTDDRAADVDDAPRDMGWDVLRGGEKTPAGDRLFECILAILNCGINGHLFFFTSIYLKHFQVFGEPQ